MAGLTPRSDLLLTTAQLLGYLVGRDEGDVRIALDVAAVGVLGTDLERFFLTIPQDNARPFNCNLKLGLEISASQF